MKRIVLGTAVAVAAMLSACQAIEQPNASVDVTEGGAVTFTASIGADTKTYIEYDENSQVFKNKWAAGDQIVILARQEDGTYAGEYAYVTDGAGTTTAKFNGSLVSDHYVAYYGYYWADLQTGTFMPSMQQYQGWQSEYDAATDTWVRRNSFSDRHYPMYAESDDNSFEFKNLCSVLKVSLTGTDFIDNIVFTPNDPSIAVGGRSYIEKDEAGNPKLVMANDSTSTYNVIYRLGLELDQSVPTDCYIVLPPQTYKGGFTITVNSAVGNMTRVINRDVTLERSQIHSLSPIAYANENLNDWGLIGSMSGWSEDVSMTYLGDGLYELKEFYLTTSDEFKFRANGDWATNLGAYDITTAYPDTYLSLSPSGANLMVSTEGYYNITLDVINQLAYFELVGQEVEPVICYSYDEVAALPDGAYVLVPGIVFGVYERGFIVNIGDYWDNCILVYQGTDQSMYEPVLGNVVDVYAYKTTYRNLPEIHNIENIVVNNAQEVDYGYNAYWNLLNPLNFDNFYTDRYDYMIYSGTLEHSNNYWNVNVDGATARVGSIDYPSQDLTPYIGQKVVVEGWFIGYSGTGGKYVSTVLKKIYVPEEGGSTEDVVPGDDIIIPETRSNLKIR